MSDWVKFGGELRARVMGIVRERSWVAGLVIRVFPGGFRWFQWVEWPENEAGKWLGFG